MQRGRVIAGLTIVAAGLLTACELGRDWNPYVRDHRELAGNRRDGPAVLQLTADGRYTCRGGPACEALGASGAWEREADFYVRFTPAAGPSVAWRLTRGAGRLRFAAGDTVSDPDMWSPDLTFEQISPAS